eukprot:2450597-Pyramimonas_sp.AAC.1
MEHADLFMDSRDEDESENVPEDASRNILDSWPPKRMRTIMSIVKHEVQSLGGRFSDVKSDSNDVSGVFCRDRLTARCGGCALHAGYALDLAIGWDLQDDPDQVREARALRRVTKPKVLMGPPNCKAFCALLSLQAAKPEVREKIVEEGQRHLDL